MIFWKQIKNKISKTEKSELIKPNNIDNLFLTQRELDVFYLLIEGFTLKEIAQKLKIKYSTVNTHTNSIYKKVNVNSRPELIIRYHNFEKEKKE